MYLCMWYVLSNLTDFGEGTCILDHNMEFDHVEFFNLVLLVEVCIELAEEFEKIYNLVLVSVFVKVA